MPPFSHVDTEPAHSRRYPWRQAQGRVDLGRVNIGLPISPRYSRHSVTFEREYGMATLMFLNDHSRRQDASATDGILHMVLFRIDKNDEGDGTPTSGDQAFWRYRKELKTYGWNTENQETFNVGRKNSTSLPRNRLLAT
ncbi:uncharacterized protein ARMOST_16768 [Armillaria ostoyae]|uniref:Uncharacterized protein n=1 Tax=Armillaria ostoyae TaxID=47428 RepID=A0A284RX55_ARMOS|nr:uncharacterized protein ARMOST_16768 [Armillaria ostoyae]